MQRIQSDFLASCAGILVLTMLAKNSVECVRLDLCIEGAKFKREDSQEALLIQ